MLFRSTITSGRLKVMGMGCYVQDMSLETLMQIGAALEKKSEHPLAEAIVEYAEKKRLRIPEVRDFKAVFGRGVEGVLAEDIPPRTMDSGTDGPTAVFVAGRTEAGEAAAEFAAKDAGARAGARYFVGNRAYMEENGIELLPEVLKGLEMTADEGMTPLLIADERRLLGMVDVADEVKPTSREAIRKFKEMGIHVVMLTGDNRRTAEAVRRGLGIEEVIAEVLPQEKEKKISQLKRAGHKVAMIGDGINDAPALAAADVGMAIGAGTDVAMESADIVLMKSDLRDAVTAVSLSRAVIRNIKQNLFWAFFYNAIGIPLAAGVWYPLFQIKLNPMFGAAAMSLSSIFVVGNALRLRGFKSGFGSMKRAAGAEAQPAKEADTLPETENLDSAVRTGAERKEIMKKVLTIEGMMCGHCTGRVQKALEAVKGVSAVSMSLEEKTATVELAEEVSDEALTAAVADAGYEVKAVG